MHGRGKDCCCWFASHRLDAESWKERGLKGFQSEDGSSQVSRKQNDCRLLLWRNSALLKGLCRACIKPLVCLVSYK